MTESSFALAVHKYVYTLLTSESPSIAAVYDHVPQGTEPPYIEIGDVTSAPDDNKTTNGETVTIEIEIHGSDRGRLQLREIARQICAVLHDRQDVDMDYGRLVHLTRDGYTDRREDGAEGGVKYSASLTFKAICHERE